MDAAERSSRRWITLPAVLVVAMLLVLVGYSAYVVHWAREREHFLQVNSGSYSPSEVMLIQVTVTRSLSPGQPRPWQLWLLHRLGPKDYVGDCSPVRKILFSGEHHSPERHKSRLDRAHRLFPAAEIVEQPMP